MIYHTVQETREKRLKITTEHRLSDHSHFFALALLKNHTSKQITCFQSISIYIVFTIRFRNVHQNTLIYRKENKEHCCVGHSREVTLMSERADSLIKGLPPFHINILHGYYQSNYLTITNASLNNQG